MSSFSKSSLFAMFAAAAILAAGCTSHEGDGSGSETDVGSGAGPDALTTDGPSITTVDQVAQELETNGGNMVPLYESVPNLLAEFIGQDETRLSTLNEQLKKTHEERSNSGLAKTKTDGESVEGDGEDESAFQLGDLVPILNQNDKVKMERRN